MLYTPGHTPEHICYLLTDQGGGADQPMGIFTGDFVFVGSIGRPDLLEEAAGIQGTAEPGARDLFRSIQRFQELPDYLQVWPAHGAGSACGKGLGAIPSSTVGYEKMFNPALQYTDEQQFVDYILSEQPEAPKYFAVMKRVNKEGPAILGPPQLPGKMPTDQLSKTVTNQMVIDTNSASNFLQAHVPGTISLQTKYVAMWGGSLLDYDQPIYLISSKPILPEIVRIMNKIGIDEIAGYFDADEVAAAGLNTSTIENVAPEAVASRLDSGELELVDVRSLNERRESMIADSDFKFLGKLFDTIGDLDASKTYVFQCRTGGRSVVAASIAERAGIKHVFNLQGGIEAWKKAGLPVSSGASEAVAVN